MIKSSFVSLLNKKKAVFSALGLAIIATTTFGAQAARSIGYHEPIFAECGSIDMESSGEDLPDGLSLKKTRAALQLPVQRLLPVHIVLDGGPENVTLYSYPAGAVSFQGTVGADSVVKANVDPNATGPVTVYAITDGATVVSAPADLGQ